MSHEEAVPLMVSLTKEFVSLIRANDPKWRKGYLRFSHFDSVEEVKASYRTDANVHIIDVRKHKRFFDVALQQGAAILSSLGKTEGIALLEVDCNLDYEFKFEYEDKNRWSISKLNGGSGLPSGFD